jgi:succinate-acetate transporter protein
MAQYVSPIGREHAEATGAAVATPIPLGLGALAFTTAIIGSVYAGFIVPALLNSLRIAIGAALGYGGIVQILAGMWEFRKDNTIAATIFSSYGGFLLAFGLAFLPGISPFNILGSMVLVHRAFGLFFLCWTIFTALLFLGSLRTSRALLLVLGFLFAGYLLLTIGELAGGATPLLIIGGWLSIVSALIAWYTALASMLEATNGAFHLPIGPRHHVPSQGQTRYQA